MPIGELLPYERIILVPLNTIKEVRAELMVIHVRHSPNRRQNSHSRSNVVWVKIISERPGLAYSNTLKISLLMPDQTTSSKCHEKYNNVG